MWARTALLVMLVGLVPMEGVLAQGPVVSYPREYRTGLVKYAVVDRVDGLSRDLYASKDAIEALTHDPGLREFPVGTLFAIDVYRAKVLGIRGAARRSSPPIARSTWSGAGASARCT